MDRNAYLPRGLIQVAGVHDLDEARLLLGCGVDLIGIPLRLPVNTEDLSEKDAASISRKLPDRICLITYLHEADAIVEMTRDLEVRFLQLHGDISLPELAAVRRRCPDLVLIKSLVIGRTPLSHVESLMKLSTPFVDAFITDTFNPATGAEGATGLTHDWSISRRLAAKAARPLILAGGLHPGNISAAVAAVQPHGVDVHTGVESADGRKDPLRVSAFVASARSTFRSS